MDISTHLANSQDVATKIALLFQRRMKTAQRHYTARMEEAYKRYGFQRDRRQADQSSNDAGSFADLWKHWLSKGWLGYGPGAAQPVADKDNLGEIWKGLLSRGWFSYAIDAAQRSILFWDTLRQRGNNFIEHTWKGLPPVLSFEYDMVMDGRRFVRPVNYALVAIRPPEGVQVDDQRRPYVIIDPRAGHGPGIGGFKDDSQVGVALAAGHPVYFVIFFREPEPGQTLLDVCAAEQRFVRTVRERHPESPKPAIVGNCQGGWGAMMLASSDPEYAGPIVINGTPMSYWGGAWEEGEGDNPMRYAGGLLGGSWTASLLADMGNGIFDGAHLVQNFENLNPANTFWDKYYHVYENADTEPPRFLEFERWWGGFYLMNREEIEWITRNLFVGNKLWSGEVTERGGQAFDLREIRSPIILFASMGDNITPPEQAFNWVADIYGSTEEIKARGQVIIGLVHRTIGHLGIFVSGKVAKKEHTQIVSVMRSVEMLPPGLYGMEITERTGATGKPEYEVSFQEHRLEDVMARLNRFKRADERPFEAVANLSEFNQRAYELFGRPMVKAMANEMTARLSRQFHPLRFQRWAISDINPWVAWLGAAAQVVANQRRAAPPTDPLRKLEKFNAEVLSAGLDYSRAVRDAVSEAAFFQMYANLYRAYLSEQREAEAERAQQAPEPPFVTQTLARVAQGGYVEAFARIAYLLSRKGEPLPLSRLTMRQELARDYGELIPELPLDQWRRIRGEQEIIVRYAPEEAIRSLPELLDDEGRQRLIKLIERVLADHRVQQAKPTAEQLEMAGRVRNVLNGTASRPVAKRRRTKSKASAQAQSGVTHH